jgi:hypothetical protein
VVDAALVHADDAARPGGLFEGPDEEPPVKFVSLPISRAFFLRVIFIFRSRFHKVETATPNSARSSASVASGRASVNRRRASGSSFRQCPHDFLGASPPRLSIARKR